MVAVAVRFCLSGKDARFSVLFVLGLLALQTVNIPTFAQQRDSASSSNRPADAGSTASVDSQQVQSGQRSTLKGGVKGAALLTVDGLQKMSESAKAVKQYSGLVVGEVTRKDTVSVRGPNVIGPGVVIPAMPNPSGTIAMGQLPVRPRMLQHFMNQLTYDVQLLQNEVDALIIPEEKAGELSGDWEKLKEQMTLIQQHYSRLKELSQGPKYDNDKIGGEAVRIYDGAEKINKIRKRLLATVKKSGR